MDGSPRLLVFSRIVFVGPPFISLAGALCRPSRIGRAVRWRCRCWQGPGEQSDPFAGVGGPEGESELVDGRVHVVAVDEVVGRVRMFRFRGPGFVHAWFPFRCLVHEVERPDAEAGGEVEDDAAAFAAGGPSAGLDASDGLRGLSGPDGEFGLAETLSRPVPGEAGAVPSGGRIVRGMVRFGPAG